jgi:hypothetical protein
MLHARQAAGAHPEGALGRLVTNDYTGLMEMRQPSAVAANPHATRALAIMQPYLFPYVGYYQLAFAADIFVVLDDVTYIKQGWINRNRVLLGGRPAWLTLPVRGASSNVAIRDVRVDERKYPFWRRKMLRSLEQEYGRAPLFQPVRALIERVLPPQLPDGGPVSQVATRSLIEVLAYLGLQLDIRFASDVPKSASSSGAQRVLAICRHFKAQTYLNSPGGQELYDRSTFGRESIELGFVVPEEEALRVARAPDGTQLSLVHGLMHQEPARLREMLRCYRVR